MRSADDLGDSLGDLAAALRDFARARNWERFHRPKNLAMALAGEASELAVEELSFPGHTRTRLARLRSCS